MNAEPGAVATALQGGWHRWTTNTEPGAKATGVSSVRLNCVDKKRLGFLTRVIADERRKQC